MYLCQWLNDNWIMRYYMSEPRWVPFLYQFKSWLYQKSLFEYLHGRNKWLSFHCACESSKIYFCAFFFFYLPIEEFIDFPSRYDSRSVRYDRVNFALNSQLSRNSDNFDIIRIYSLWKQVKSVKKNLLSWDSFDLGLCMFL